MILHFFARPLSAAALFVLTALLTFGCSGSKNVSSLSVQQPISIDGDFDDWPSSALRSTLIDDFDVAIANDDRYVYIGVNFRNNRTWQMARDHGFRMFFDNGNQLRRSFGIVFPTGIVESLGDYPGARQNYLENPGWQNMPDNQRLVQQAEQQLGERVQVIRRTERRDRIRPSLVSRERLEANGILTGASGSSRVMSIEVRIPIDDGSGDFFAITPDNNGRFYIDFEIEPMSYEEITGENPTFETVETADRRDPTGRSTRTRQQLSVSNPRLYAQLSYIFQERVRVTLSREE
ncbi:hypothetical protein CYPRO_3300 [Cyclonatronum proteinivorum]|uniref:Uncharacterized protein n=1 Tax=Cyclonatronum proteinivorum TaxID=1457365 RepID=A0A345UPY1_9BACT|nr:hypothetical protein [Cyclonatronum proteinivorum]AXJ02533.1 hypothetical protein CYPRO_3300 [Cyclonatronum proteinivorum]